MTSRSSSGFSRFALSLALLGLTGLACQAAPKSWTGANSTDWFDSGNWSGGLPLGGDDVTIGAAARTVLLTTTPPHLHSLTITNNTLIFTNWSATLNADTVTIQGGGIFTMSGSFATNQMSNRVSIACTDFTIEKGGLINADAHGYYPWNGPGAGDYFETYYYHAGGSYGGRGGHGGTGNHGDYWPSFTYGSASAPTQPGSGGGSYSTVAYQAVAGSGGGAVRIAAGGTVTVRGTISANGGTATGDYGAGGSGGAIYITCVTFGGDSNGLLRVNGGNSLNANANGGGGGGRIAVTYTSATPGPRFSAAPATVSWAYMDPTNCFHYLPMAGTLCLPDAQALSETLDQTLIAGAVNIQGFTNWAPDSLTVSNCTVIFGQDGVVLSVTNNVVVDAGGSLGLGSYATWTNYTLNCGGSLILTNGGGLVVYSGATGGVANAYGALVSVTNDLIVGVASWVQPISHWTNGGAALFRCGNLVVETNGGFNAAARGYVCGAGPGAGAVNGYSDPGGSYGGRGGSGPANNAHLSKSTCGSVSQPIDSGSGGGTYGYATTWPFRTKGASGGGVIRIEATNTVTVRGTLTAKGGKSYFGIGAGAAGGAVYIKCLTFGGTTDGLISADGGDAYPSSGLSVLGGGGGGRIAIDYRNVAAVHAVRFSARPAAVDWADQSDKLWKYAAQPGTLWLKDTAILTETLDGQFDDVNIFGITNWAPASLTVSNCWVSFAEDQGRLAVAGDIRVDTNGALGIGMLSQGPNCFLNCGGNLMLTNGGVLNVFAGPTNYPAATNYGALVAVTNSIIVSASSWICPYSHDLNGGSPLICASNIVIAAGGGIDANNRGFASGYGPGSLASGYNGNGAGYGGRGGYCGTNGGQAICAGGPTYGSPDFPIDPGSGGNGHSGHRYAGPSGGGVIRLQVDDTLTLRGALVADGGTSTNGLTGGGSGGGIYVKCQTLDGLGAEIRADGGNPLYDYNAAGGGGRIALDYQQLGANRDFHISTAPGSLHWSYGRMDELWQYHPRMGTVSLPDAELLPSPLTGIPVDEACLYFMKTNAWDVSSLTVTNCTLSLAEANFILTVTNDLVIGTGADFGLGGDPGGSNIVLACGGGVLLTNGGIMTVYGGRTNGIANAWCALVSATNDFVVASGSWVRPEADPVSGGTPLFRMNNLLIAPGGGFNADNKGYGSQRGPGKGANGGAGGAGGGGHGGKGGNGSGGAAGGAVYDATNGPVQGGSGGGSYDAAGYFIRGGIGGGAVRVEAGGTIAIDGTLTANGSTPIYAHSAGGAGGAIYLACSGFSGGTGAVMSADGGDGYNSLSGGGGGGRIAVWRGVDDATRQLALAGDTTALSNLTIATTFPNYNGDMTATNGSGALVNPANPGTLRFIRIVAGAVRWLEIHGDPNDTLGAPQPFGYGTHEDIPIGAWITNSVVTPADEAAGVRHACLGWDLKDDLGATLDNDSGTQAMFQVTTNLYLTWHWTNEYELIAGPAADTNGSVNAATVNGWYTNAIPVAGILATASNGWLFSQWTGDVPAPNATDNPLTLDMTQPRTIVANFIPFVINTKVWTGMGNWTNGANWDPAGVPSPVDNAIIGAGTVTVAQAAYAGSLVVSNGATLIFTNWTTKLFIDGDMTVLSNGLVTLPPAFSNLVTVMSNRVNIGCSNLTVAPFGQINADARGYSSYNGPGRGTTENNYGNGGGYGGRGGKGANMNYAPGPQYGSTNTPLEPGSGGGSYISAAWQLLAGAGGGAIRLDAEGTVTVNGTISANGGAPQGADASGGSGGSIYITCQTFGGTTSGVIRTKGGDGWAGYNTGAGGGGRIAVNYLNLAATHAARFSASPGGIEYADLDLTNRWRDAAQMGTLWLADAELLSSSISNGLFQDVALVIGNATTWAVDRLTVNDCAFTFVDNGFKLTVTNALTIGSGGSLGIGAYYDSGTGFVLNCGGSLTLTNGGKLYVYSGATNGAGTNYGALVSVAGDMVLAPGSRLYVRSHGTDGGSPLFVAGSLTIETNGVLDAIAGGYSRGSGPGASPYGGTAIAGSGYGGKGGSCSDANWGGSPYGSVDAPADPGSAGSAHPSHTYASGLGGGLVRMSISGTATIRGLIAADGGTAIDANVGGGSGGGIYIQCHTFGGTSDGLLSACGGNPSSAGYSGGGGGGRIALDYQTLAAGCGVRFSAAPADVSWAYYDPENLWQHYPQAGTLWLPDTAYLGASLVNGIFNGCRVYLPTNAWNVTSLLVSNVAVNFAGSGFQLTVTNDIVITGNGSLGIGDDPIGTNYLLTCGRLTMTTGSSFYAYGGLTNAAATNYGTLVSIGGNMVLGDGAWVYPVAHPTNGGTVLFRMADLSIGLNAGFNANVKGFFSVTGPGKGGGAYYAGGAGHGGQGGEGASYGGGAVPPGGPVYDSTNEPAMAGSGGGTYTGGGYYGRGGHGGGAVRIAARGELRLNGSILANGGRGLVAGNAGAGAGGSIYIQCADFKPGQYGVLSANGGYALTYGGGGGGGRIAVWKNVSDSDRARIEAGLPPLNASITNDFSAKYPLLTFTVDPGAGYASTNPAQPGTVVFINGITPGSLFVIW